MDDSIYEFQPLETDTARSYSARLKQCKRSPNLGLFFGIIAAGAVGLFYWQVSKMPASGTELPANKVVAQSPIAIPKVDSPALVARHEKQALEPLAQEASLNPDSATDSVDVSEKLAIQESADTAIVQDSPQPAPSIEPDVENKSGPTQKSPESPAKVKETNRKKVNQKGPEQSENDLFGPPFSATPLAANEPDPDQLPVGTAKLTELVRQAREANAECVTLAQECRPVVVEIANLRAVVALKRVAAAQADIEVKALDPQLAILSQRVRFSNVGRLLNAQEDQLRAARDKQAGIRDRCNAEADAHSARIGQLSETVQYSRIKFKRRWDDLNFCRKDWLEICRPHDKYARADFEGAKRVTDEWLTVDTLWMDAYCWSALCAYELGEYLPAKERIETAEKLRTEVLGQVRSVRFIEAMQGLVAIQQPAQRSKSTGMIQKAMTNVDKDDWQTPFVAGRAAVELGHQDSKAKAYFERALKINPDCEYARYWLGHLQATSTEARVRDLDAGIAMLESTWSFSRKRSWRVGVALARAYDAANRGPAANSQWKATLELVPVSERSKLNVK
jgi:tetratricopeptide (TPR) repeat protein